MTRRAASTLLVVFATALSAVSIVDAKAKTVAGHWTLSVEHLPLRMVLSQQGRTVTGTLDYPHGAPFRLKGTFTNGVLTFSGDSSGEGFTIHIDATGALNADGSLGGTIIGRIVDVDAAHQPVRTHNENWTWKAERAAQTDSAR
jgi:hypothetical protein